MTPRMKALKTRIMAEGVVRYKRVADLAEAAGVSHTTVYRFFGGGDISTESVLAIARAVGLEVVMQGNEPLSWKRAEVVTAPVVEIEPVGEDQKAAPRGKKGQK